MILACIDCGARLLVCDIERGFETCRGCADIRQEVRFSVQATATARHLAAAGAKARKRKGW